MAEVSEGWALELRGDQFDLDDLREALKAPFDPWVEEYVDGESPMLLLRSRNWKDIQTASEMMNDARRLVDQINGAHLVGQPDARPISHGITLRFTSEGKRVPIIISATATITLGGFRSRARLSTGATPSAPVQSSMQRQLARASCEDVAADLLAFISRADNWFDIFKAMECVQVLAGGQRKVPALAPSLERARQTANWHRHAPSPKFPQPKEPLNLDEVRALVLVVAKKVL